MARRRRTSRNSRRAAHPGTAWERQWVEYVEEVGKRRWVRKTTTRKETTQEEVILHPYEDETRKYFWLLR